MSKINPFSPDKPISPENFAGRKNELTRLLDAIEATTINNCQQVFITGERGIGKTSLARYGYDFARKYSDDKKLLSIYLLANDQYGIDNLCQSIIKELERNAIRNKISGAIDFLRERVKIKLPIGELDMSRSDIVEDISIEFAYLIQDFIVKTGGKYNGFCIFIDEIERMSKRKGLASFYKSLIEKLIIDGYSNSMFVLIGIPRAFDDLIKDHASIGRIFTPVKLGLMTIDETKEIITNALNSVNVNIEDTALSLLVRLSSGYPALTHEFGYFAYEVDKDGCINEDDVIASLNLTMKQLRRKFFDKMYLTDIQSDRYREILDIIASNDNDVVEISYIKERFSGNNNTINTYLSRLVERKLLIKPRTGRGLYQLPNLPFKLYIRALGLLLNRDRINNIN